MMMMVTEMMAVQLRTVVWTVVIEVMRIERRQTDGCTAGCLEFR